MASPSSTQSSRERPDRKRTEVPLSWGLFGSRLVTMSRSRFGRIGNGEDRGCLDLAEGDDLARTGFVQVWLSPRPPGG